MKKLFFFLSLACLFAICQPLKAEEAPVDTPVEQVDSNVDTQAAPTETAQSGNGEPAVKGKDDHAPNPLSVIPFALLLLMIATGPLFYEHFWHKNYPIVAVVLGLVVVIYYLFFLGDQHHPVHSLAEYVSFICLVGSLFVAAGGILIKIDKPGTPAVNLALLVFGAAIANVIGTTGASMLLIFPFIRLNKHRIKPYHIIFFIFMVSNVGGCLTPIGDPPLFLGFLKGVSFFWTAENLWLMWFFGIGLLGVMFYFLDSRNHKNQVTEREESYSGKMTIRGKHNIIYLVIVIGAVFLDPNIFDWVPAINYHGDKLSFLRELIMLVVAIMAFKTADKDCLRGNEFTFEPIREVGFLFIGIFATMMPALQLIAGFAENNSELIDMHALYWATGSLSGVLDNAPTYLNFLAAGMGKFGLDIGSSADVQLFMNAATDSGNEAYKMLTAISISAVFFGAFTYIGNAPNFMVKSIAEQVGIEMPSFVSYVVKYSIPILLPILALTWLVFFVL